MVVQEAISSQFGPLPRAAAERRPGLDPPNLDPGLLERERLSDAGAHVERDRVPVTAPVRPEPVDVAARRRVALSRWSLAQYSSGARS